MQDVSQPMSEAIIEAVRAFDDEMATLREENILLKGELARYENKRKRGGGDEILEKECIHCKETKLLSSFQTKTNKKNKEAHIIEYYSQRTMCHSCHKKKYRDNKKIKLSK